MANKWRCTFCGAISQASVNICKNKDYVLQKNGKKVKVYSFGAISQARVNIRKNKEHVLKKKMTKK